MAISQRRMTLAEFLELPEEKPALEFFDGEVTQKVSPMGRHSVLQMMLVQLCNLIGSTRRLFLALPELRATYGGVSTVPDVSVYRWERIPRNERGEVADRFFVPPDVAVEIVSPDQSVNLLVSRCLWYVDNGAGAALLVDPDHRSVLVFRPGAEPVVRRGADEVDLSDVLPDLRFTVKQLFGSLRLD
jgi:Uma2 family endonuclease